VYLIGVHLMGVYLMGVHLTGSDLSYRGEACQHLNLDLVDLEVKCYFRIRKV
jgi:hypothetical protein